MALRQLIIIITLTITITTTLLPTLTLCLPSQPLLPLAINTWSGPFTASTNTAFHALHNASLTALDAVHLACAVCEDRQCDRSVGFGGSPDEACETTLDALIIDGDSLNSGAVAALRRVRNAIGVARRVLEFTSHSMLAGDLATEFALQNGFTAENLTTEESAATCNAWKQSHCQPNYRLNVLPSPSSSCGPYTPSPDLLTQETSQQASHDTLSLVVLHSSGSMAAGTTTNGAAHKIPGRVGDGPIMGSGSYVDSEVGGCGATGDGDVMMRFLPCYQAVESLRRGMTPTEAAEDAVRRMVKKYPDVKSGIVVMNNKGEHGAAASGWTFTYSYRGGNMEKAEVVTVPSIERSTDRRLEL